MSRSSQGKSTNFSLASAAPSQKGCRPSLNSCVFCERPSYWKHCDFLNTGWKYSHGEEGLVGVAKSFFDTRPTFRIPPFFDIASSIIDRSKVPPPSKHLDISALRLPTLARHQPFTWFRVKVGNCNGPMSRWLQGGSFFYVYDSTYLVVTTFGHLNLKKKCCL